MNQIIKSRIEKLSKTYRELTKSNRNAIKEISAAELPEMVYNSNAIENSTLTLEDTEEILIHNMIRTDHEIREIYEAKNLAKAIEYLDNNPDEPFTAELILKLHKILLTDINDNAAGRFRSGDEWVRVGTHIGANPDFVNELIYDLVKDYNDNKESYFIEKIAHFHAEFENIHPFIDGNGRIGRLLLNRQLKMEGLPPIIIANKTKTTEYYPLLAKYEKNGTVDDFVDLIAGLVIESLYRRIAKLTAKKIIPLTDWAKARELNIQAVSNKALRGTIPAFRINDHWMINAVFEEAE